MNKKGFTLIELSIVLVIIGLLIGGILVAQSLIDSATNQGIVRSLNQAKIINDTFKSIYRKPLGDVSNSKLPTTYDGDENGKVDNNEFRQTWSQAKLSGMLGDNIELSVSGYGEQLNIDTGEEGAGIFIMYGSGWQYKFGNIMYIGRPNVGGLTTQQTFYVDRKMDDGNPITGDVFGTSLGDGSSSGCLIGTSSPNNYYYAWQRNLLTIQPEI